MAKSLHRYSFYALILAVYGVFFSIQTFYNFEGHSDAKEIISHSLSLHSASSDAGSNAVSVSLPGSQKAKIRLNKRFHQEEFSPCAVYQVGAVFLPAAPRRLGFLVSEPLSSAIVAHPQLRGPPSMA